jgi:hypothetical protein
MFLLLLVSFLMLIINISYLAKVFILKKPILLQQFSNVNSSKRNFVQNREISEIFTYCYCKFHIVAAGATELACGRNWL